MKKKVAEAKDEKSALKIKMTNKITKQEQEIERLKEQKECSEKNLEKARDYKNKAYKKLDKNKTLAKEFEESKREIQKYKQKIKEEAEQCKREIRVLKMEVDDETQKREQVIDKKKAIRKELDKLLTKIKLKHERNEKLLKRAEKIESQYEGLKQKQLSLLIGQNKELKAVQKEKKDELDFILKNREEIKNNIQSIVSPRKLIGTKGKKLEYSELEALLRTKVKKLDQEIDILSRQLLEEEQNKEKLHEENRQLRSKRSQKDYYIKDLERKSQVITYDINFQKLEDQLQKNNLLANSHHYNSMTTLTKPPSPTLPQSRNLMTSATTAVTPVTAAARHVNQSRPSIKLQFSSNLAQSMPQFETGKAKNNAYPYYKTQNNSPSTLRRAGQNYYEDASRALTNA